MKRIHIHYLITHGIGDVVMTIPTLKEIINKNSADISITVKTKTEADVISELLPGLKIQFIYFQTILKRSGHVSAFYTLIKKLRQIKPDIIIAQYGVTSAKSSLISFFSGIKHRIGWKGPFSVLNSITLTPSGQHKIAENLRVFKFFDKEHKISKIEYPQYQPDPNYIHPPFVSKHLQKKDRYLVFSPGSGELEKHKRWPASHFSDLANRLLSDYTDLKILVVGSENERKLGDEIVQGIKEKDRILNLAGNTSIKELIEILSGANLIITNCNGLSHLAGCVSCPIIGLYGPTNYKHTGPLSSSFIPLSAGLDCAPCYRKGYETGCENPTCMNEILVDNVFAKVKEILSNKVTE